MGGFTQETEAMAKGAQSVDEAHKQIRTHIGQLRQHAEHMAGGWKGHASASFVNAHNRFEENAQKINQALDAMHQALVETHRTYAQSEDHGSSNFNNISNQL